MWAEAESNPGASVWTGGSRERHREATVPEGDRCHIFRQHGVLSWNPVHAPLSRQVYACGEMIRGAILPRTPFRFLVDGNIKNIYSSKQCMAGGRRDPRGRATV